MSSIINQVPYLRTSRDFPEDDAHQLSVEINRTYVDIADKVNNRTIGLFPTTRPAINGESWFLSKNQRQQGFRQVYTFGNSIVNNSTIEIGFKFSSISMFTPKCYGVFTDGSNWYGLIFASSTKITGQVTFYLFEDTTSTTSDQIVFKVDSGAPSISSGMIVLEWISEV